MLLSSKIDASGIGVMFNLSRTSSFVSVMYTWLPLRISGLGWQGPYSSVRLAPGFSCPGIFGREHCSREKWIPRPMYELKDHSCSLLLWGQASKDTGRGISSYFSHTHSRTLPLKTQPAQTIFCGSCARPTTQKHSFHIFEIHSRAQGDGSAGEVLGAHA